MVEIMTQVGEFIFGGGVCKVGHKKIFLVSDCVIPYIFGS